MSVGTYKYWLDDRPWLDRLIGQRVVEASDDTLTLSNGVQLRFQKANDDCCSYIELGKLATTDNIITAASVGDNEGETGGEGPYDAWVYVVTEAGVLNIAEAHGDASNGYYLHGFALDVTVIEPAVA
ncbi:MAG TPA: hypothetical protein VFH54_00790 [Mycobacteriales bacterium]|nr:hypothetical protein [Mycobacteriales bacterium]